MIETLIFSIVVFILCFIGFGVGVFFFGKSAQREACGSVPEVEAHEDCPNQRAGLCPVLDKEGTLKMANKAKISYTRHDLAK